MYEDKTLVCKECGKEFTFTAGEQEFYAERGFVNEPQRCKDCRDARKNKIKTQKEMYTTTCAACGCEAKVPFKHTAWNEVDRVLRKHLRLKAEIPTNAERVLVHDTVLGQGNEG